MAVPVTSLGVVLCPTPVASHEVSVAETDDEAELNCPQWRQAPSSGQHIASEGSGGVTGVPRGDGLKFRSSATAHASFG